MHTRVRVAFAGLLVVLVMAGASAAHEDHGHEHGHDHHDQEQLHSSKPAKHECMHDTIRKLSGYGESAEVIDVDYGQYSAREFHPQQAATYQPLRVKVFFDQGDCASGTTTCGHCTTVGQTVTTFEGGSSGSTTCSADDVLTTAKKDYIMNTLMTSAANFYSAALNVLPVSGNLVVSGSAVCGSTPGTPVPSSHQTTGVPEADFVVYVTAVPKSDRTSATVAWASACRKDAAGRAIVAHVNFVPAKLTNAVALKAVDAENDKATAVHEIAHALGFTAPFFGTKGYLAADGSGYVVGGTTTETSSTLGKTVSYITSPRVVAEVRRYFACDTLVGAEIEDQGGSGTAGSHFEKRIFYEDSMAGISSSVITYHSRALLAFFEDTGYYTANYGAADTRMSWGRGKGCGFALNKCNAPSTAWEEFCFDSDTSNTYCTFDRLARGYCGTGQYTSALPSHFQYFPSNAALGGSIQHTDYCPAVLPYGNRICIDPSNSDGTDVYGTTYSTASRCFDSNLLSATVSGSGSRRETRCFVPVCQGVRLTIMVKNTRVTCPADGSAGPADLSALNGAYTGTITCPASSVFGCGASGSTTTAPGSPGSPASPASPTSPTTSSTAAPGATSSPAPTLPAACSDRIPCAQSWMAAMPQCRLVAKGVAACFGTNCDKEMMSFFAANGVQPNCASESSRAAYAASCMEGSAGVADLCRLATSWAAPRPLTLALSCLLPLALVLMLR